MSIENLLKWYVKADHIDRYEGTKAYERYHNVIRAITEHYWSPERFEEVLAAFVALSPNSDYLGNLRSLVTLLRDHVEGRDTSQTPVSTYNHCRDRARKYLSGEADFLSTVKGKKIRAFYDNILKPEESLSVTIDGHMMAAWLGADGMTMKEATVSPRKYMQVEEAVQLMAQVLERRPHAVQATIWFARKRVLNVKYNPQLDILGDPKDIWKTGISVSEIVPYTK